MRFFNPVSTALHGTPKVYVNPSMKNCSHIFLRSDKVDPPLSPPYTGPYLVISRKDKNFIIDLNGKHSTVSIDRVKPAYLLADDTDQTEPSKSQPILEKSTVPPNTTKPSTISRYGRTVRFPKHLVTDYIVEGKMELTREHCCAMIFYDFKAGFNQEDCIQHLRLAFGNEGPSSATVFRWFTEFHRGRNSFQDEETHRKVLSAEIPDNVSASTECYRRNLTLDPPLYIKLFMKNDT
ncbi:hypothetical protein HNY73_003248 [Argiope bruennichi]|uniref:Mos1 transposase HTH domain-containing protein n=1 Tax=Argiope bruennichi TaxID=94029 RepID=A0A8T0FYQ3_ARGBR|nr:hypothetical protein HNY73_003248 [Argiope bruennichi]